MKKWLNFNRELIKKMTKNRITGLAAEQAFYYLLSIFPFLILVLSILPYLSINPKIASDFLHDFVPVDTSQLIEGTFISILSERSGKLLTIGLIGTIWSSSKGMNSFIYSMNIAFEVKETRNYISNRFLSIIMTIGLISAFVIALLLPVFGNILLNLVDKIVPISSDIERIIHVSRWGIAAIAITSILAWVYKLAPNIHLSLKQVLVGAIIAAILWILVSLGFAFYVENFGHYSATYGSLGGVIVLMLWLYVSGLSLIIGGEINALLFKRLC